MARTSTFSSTAASNGQPVAVPEPENGGSTTRQWNSGSKSTSKGSNDSSDDFDEWEATDPTRGVPMPCDASLYPAGSRSLTFIGEQAFFLGTIFATSLLTLFWLTVISPNELWRLSAFTGCLSIFHFLEYETTARYNLPTLRASSFLLFTNGQAYNIAYGLAIVEIVESSYFPSYQAAYVNAYTLGCGIALVVIGQVIRSIAMIQAGTNFNHTPANKKREGHELVTKGVYSWLRHPSYFGFFWWAVGTQLMVGNKACVFGYVFVLWNFFNHRIIAEEKKLVEFFGADYEEFRSKTATGIPFIR